MFRFDCALWIADVLILSIIIYPHSAKVYMVRQIFHFVFQELHPLFATLQYRY